MRQIFQDLKSGEILSTELPRPGVPATHVLIRSVVSLVSPGTERMLLEFGKGGWISKAKQHPEKLAEVFQKIKSDGLGQTVKAVFNKLNQPLPLGYSNVGIVEEIGSSVLGITKGTRVLSNGPHAELVLVPSNLCIPIPDSVSDEDAAFGVLSAIALQGTRLLKPELGETVCVIGLGLLGLISVKLLKANGCKVIAFDTNPSRVALANALGANSVELDGTVDPIRHTNEATEGFGADGVLICAATASNDPIQLAPQLCRKRGRVVLVGVVGLELRRKDFYEKEISFQVSCSYGPGRYDEVYEKQGLDYPIGFVRWTEGRNLSAVLSLMEEGKLSLSTFITRRVPFAFASVSYPKLVQDTSQLGILFQYQQGDTTSLTQKTVVISKSPSGTSGLSFIGSGGHARAALAPAFKNTGANFRGICSQRGITSQKLGVDFGFNFNTTSIDEILNDDLTDAVVISTRHDSHAELVARSLSAKKNVFVEKPLATSLVGLRKIQTALRENPSLKLMVGYNRRYAPLSLQLIKQISNRTAPIAITMTINAGSIPRENWNNNPAEGGGRLIGEACHFIDLAQAIADSPIKQIYCQPVIFSEDNALNNGFITLECEDGSIASINYLSNGSKEFPKETIQVFSSGRIFVIDNFVKLTRYGVKLSKPNFLKKQDKGHDSCAKAFVSKTTGSTPARTADQTFHIALACLAAVESANRGSVVKLRDYSQDFAKGLEDFPGCDPRKAHSG